MPTSSLQTLGRFSFEVDGAALQPVSTKKARALLSHLVMQRGNDLPRERLFDLFWRDVDPDRARDSLRTALWSIRRILRASGHDAAEFLFADNSIVRWTAETACDATRFVQATLQNTAADDQEALQLYRGDFLEGDYDDWTIAERERLAGTYEALLARILRTSEDADIAQRLLARSPYDERAYATLIETALVAGRRSTAAAYVARCRAALAEVGEEPSASFEERFGELRSVETAAAAEVSLPFVGRESELAHLAAVFDSAMSGEGRVLLVHGAAGIGKSTLLLQAASAAAKRALRVLTVQCIESDARIFGPWQALFEAATGRDTASLPRQRADELVGTLVEGFHDNLTGPTILFVDDAQYLAGDSLELFTRLVEALVPPHSVVAAVRPEGLATMRSRFAETRYEELHVGRLSRDELEGGLAHVTGDSAGELLDALYNRSAGHPFFFLGLLQSLVHAGTLQREGHRWRIAHRLDTRLELPTTLTHYIASRLRARGEDAYLVGVALAVEPGASAEDLVAVLKWDETRVFDALDDLLSLGVIVQPATGPRFAFAHDLIREVAASGLHAGRLSALHRAYADRLEASAEYEASLRRARHQRASGQYLAAGESYFRAAVEALRSSAVQDADELSSEGIATVARLRQALERDVALAKLQRLKARAALASGDFAIATEAADAAVASARSGGDAHELAHSLVTRAEVERWTGSLADQRTDSAEAAVLAGQCHDEALVARAILQSSNASRLLALREDALDAAQRAYSIAVQNEFWNTASMALAELLQSQLTWWLFEGALETARATEMVARRAESLSAALAIQSRAALWYLLERYDDSERDLQTALSMVKSATDRPESPLDSDYPAALQHVECAYLRSVLAAARLQWDAALEMARSAVSLKAIGRSSRHAEVLHLLQIDVLLSRNAPGDAICAQELTGALGDADGTQSILGWSDCALLAKARVACYTYAPNAEELLRRAINVVEENASRTPLEADRAFEKLAAAANVAGAELVRRRATARREYYRERRAGAAGAAWGGRAVSSASLSR